MATARESAALSELRMAFAEYLPQQIDPALIPGEDLIKLWEALDGPQRLALQSEADELFYGGAGGGGKLLDLDEPVATPWGWKKNGELAVGDQLCNPDGSVARVVALYDVPNQPMYRVTFDDGAQVQAGGQHLWLTRRPGVARFRARDKGDRPERFSIRTTDQILRASEHGHKIGIPLSSPVAYTNTSRYAQTRWPVKPYTLGALLGDGHLADASSTLTCADPEIVELIRADGYDHTTISTKPGNAASSYPYRGRLAVAIKALGLAGARSWEKFIPPQYLTAGLATRFALMRGLMDTDGYADDRGHASYTSTSMQLATDVQTLARGLGFKASITKKVPTYRLRGELLEGRLAFTVWIKGPNHAPLFGLARKKQRADQAYNGGNGERLRLVTNIELLRKDVGRCIMVDHPNGLYLTRDFIVTHNSDLLLGVAATAQHKSVIFRTEFAQFRGPDGLIERSKEMIGQRGHWNGQGFQWRGLPGGRSFEFAGVKTRKDLGKWKGRPHDFKGFDEITEFPEHVYRFLIGWLRTAIIGLRTRVITTGNPPTTPAGEWIIQYWGPWLDVRHPNPAKPGELRWFAQIDGKDQERPTRDPFWVGGRDDCAHVFDKWGVTCLSCGADYVQPRSRTFIPAKVEDNPHYMRTGYVNVLNALPEPLRSQLRHGDFAATQADDPWQVIPTSWVDAAIARWKATPPPTDLPLECVGNDPSRGGKDQFVIVKRYGWWIAPIIKHPGRTAPDGPSGVLHLQHAIRGEHPLSINIDVIGSAGSSVYDYARDARLPAVGLNGSERDPSARDRSGRLTFKNKRAMWHWHLRELLDPVNGMNMALPDDPEMRSDLIATRWKPTPQGIQVLEKDQVKELIGRSPDCGDGVIYACAQDSGNAAGFLAWARQQVAEAKTADAKPVIPNEPTTPPLGPPDPAKEPLPPSPWGAPEPADPDAPPPSNPWLDALPKPRTRFED